MTLRVVTPANGAPSVSIAWDCGTVTVPAGSVLDIPPGGALESAYGLSNLTALTGNALSSDQTGSDQPSISN